MWGRIVRQTCRPARRTHEASGHRDPRDIGFLLPSTPGRVLVSASLCGRDKTHVVQGQRAARRTASRPNCRRYAPRDSGSPPTTCFRSRCSPVSLPSSVKCSCPRSRQPIRHFVPGGEQRWQQCHSGAAEPASCCARPSRLGREQGRLAVHDRERLPHCLFRFNEQPFDNIASTPDGIAPGTRAPFGERGAFSADPPT